MSLDTTSAARLTTLRRTDRTGFWASDRPASGRDGSGALTDSYSRPRDADVKGWMIDYDVALKRTFEQRKHELSGELRFNRAHDEDNALFWRWQ